MTKNYKIRYMFGFLFLLLTILLIIFIFAQSLKNADISSAESGRVLAFLNKICEDLGLTPFFTQKIVRTLAHFGEFGLLGVLASLSSLLLLTKKNMKVVIPISIVVLTAVCDECLQLFSDGRAFQVSDLLIDFSGGLLAVFVIFLIVTIVDFVSKNKKV